jgi:FADH2 O2-dependent halogenase
MQADFDIAVIGSGFAGSLMAMIARRLGRSVVLLERGRHPRFAIGESSTPLANLLLEELARRYELPALAPLTKWGSWQKSYPKIGCGLKRGFTFYHHVFDQPWSDDAWHRNQLLVAASPHDGVADTHWYRADFDQFLAQQAEVLGAEFLDEVKLRGVEFSSDGAELHGERRGQTLSLRARFLVDASGPRGFLHGALRLPEKPWEAMPRTQGLYSQFDGARRWDELHPSSEAPPYPVDDAALHHVFDGGWIWVLRFNNGLTSAGVAATESLAAELRLEEGAAAWERLLKRLPSVREQFANARPTLPFMHAPQLSFCTAAVAGECRALLPSAVGFVDPLLSTGFPLTLLGIERLARILGEYWDSASLPKRLGGYSVRTLEELDASAALIGALYKNMADSEMFSALTRLYFAAASFSESVRRLNRPELADSFLLLDHPKFGPTLRRCCDQARQVPTASQRAELIETIYESIEPIDVAGLGRRERRNWHPVLAEDFLDGAHKLGVGRKQVKGFLLRCGFSMK